MHRSATSQSCRTTIKTPRPIQQVQNRKKALLSRNITRSANKSHSQFKEVATPFRETGITFTRHHPIERIKSSSQIKKATGFLSQNFYPYNEKALLSSKSLKNMIPLRILNIEKTSDDQSPYCNAVMRFHESVKQRQYLRKGTAINKAIMYNVLKSKHNKNISDTAASYTNYQGNQALSTAIYDQVPKGLRDVIGPEEMLRMSNIFTGGTISAVNLHKKVNDIITKYHQCRDHLPVPDDEGMTLKSIKRW